MPPSKPSIDWEAVWKSLNWSDETRQERSEQERLRQRADQYALPLVEKVPVPENARTFLRFRLGEETYAGDVMVVRGARAVPQITWVPGTPDFYRGVMNLRGQIITVFDLRLFFGLPVTDADPLPGEVVVVHSGALHLGFLTHEIIGIANIAADEINPIENLRYAQGITADRTIVLNLKSLLDDERLIVGARI